MSNAGESPALNGNVRNVPPQGFSFIGFTLPQSATAVNAWRNGISKALCRMPYSDRRPLHSASPISRIEVTHGALTSKLGRTIMMAKKLGKWGIQWKKKILQRSAAERTKTGIWPK